MVAVLRRMTLLSTDLPTLPPKAERLLAWYDRHHRVLPWRISPAEAARGVRADPYRIWLSEVMLQQTTVEAVKKYFLAFTERWPDVLAMAAASEDDILRAWAGLGYYSRARNLKKCADTVAQQFGGQFPDTEEGLRALPGVGAYTAAAIAAIAFNRPAVVIDGNIERVVTRLYRIDTPLPQAKSEIRTELAKIVPADRPGDFAQALMDLGSSICTPRRPTCILCPFKDDCQALALDEPERFPVKKPKAERPVRHGAAFVAVRADGAILLRKRPDKGLLGGMAEVPCSAWQASGGFGPDEAPFQADWKPSGTITHIFTHFALMLDVYRAPFEGPAPSDMWWSAPSEVAGEALPTVMKKAIEAAVPDAFRQQAR
ncbi:A/G-specific adenine glycosylase [Tianweitania sp. BSSL-BM11]|uniref:Adenine DNA glycosylase n=2 Tax=Tianweitania aestuarii TaxID=2814886 RepID=A0ABS5RS06_9HYPH|nr:A/G-specific adenine glycosylase [Tianweitania aestuarii]